MSMACVSGKRTFQTRMEAKKVRRAIKRLNRENHADRNNVPCPYQCRLCGKWHMRTREETLT